MPAIVKTVNLESGMPTVDDARRRLNDELRAARQSGVLALKLIHGYGSSGVGGALRTAIRQSLARRRKEGVIRLFVAGEKWSVFEPDCLAMLDACPELKRDRDLSNANAGITLVLF